MAAHAASGKTCPMPLRLPSRTWSIRGQLTAAFILFALLNVVIGGVALARLFAGAEEAAVAEATAVTNTLAYVLTDDAQEQRPLIDDPDRLQEFISELHANDERAIVVVDKGQLILSAPESDEVGLEFLQDPEDEVGAAIRDDKTITFLGRSAGDPDGIRLVAAPIRVEATGVVIGAIIYEYTPLYAALAGKATVTAAWIAIATGVILLLAVVVAFALARRVAAPLHALTIGALTIATADIGADRAEIRLPRSATREVVDLTDAIIRLRRALDLRVEAATVDAAHAGTLTRLGELIAFSDGEDELIDAATGTIERMVTSSGGNLLLLNPSEDRLTIGGVWGCTTGKPGAVVSIDRPSRCPGIRRGSAYVVADASDRLQAHCRAYPATTGSLLCIPMLALGKVVGVIHVYAEQAGAFSDRDRETITRVAEQSALALSNARLIKTMESLAMTDNLTGLFNGRFFDPLLQRELALAERDGLQVGVIMLDLDHFKQFNDAHGHPAGDEALKTFARAAQGALRESDVLARYGGEEFVVLVRAADLKGTAIVAEKLRAAVEATVVNVGPGHTARITVSAGVSSTAGHGLDRMVLLRVADEALYQAKQEGRNRVVVSRPLFTVRASREPRVARRRTPATLRTTVDLTDMPLTGPAAPAN